MRAGHDAAIWVGTSGFQYPEWKGSFYPSDLPASKMLGYYAERFPSTEINYSFYRIPSAKTLAGWSSATPAKFRFSLKAPQQVTHILRLRNCGDVLARFATVLKSLDEKLGTVLFQLPPHLKNDSVLLEEFLHAIPSGLISAMEFRHESWFNERTFEILHSGKIALCIAESEKLATPAVFTADHAYLRLRREDYTRKDIAKWAAVILEQTRRLEHVHVYFKHEERGLGPRFAGWLITDLEREAEATP